MELPGSDKYDMLLAGFGGSLLYISAMKSFSWKAAVAAVMCGTMLAHWFAQPLIHLFRVPEDFGLGLAGLLGISGFILVLKFVHLLSQWSMKDSLRGVLGTWLNLKKE